MLEPGIHYDIPFAVYKKLPCMSKSGLDRFTLAPMLYEGHVDECQKSTSFFDNGRAVHTRVLQPELIEQEVAVGPEARKNSNDWKTFETVAIAENPDRPCLKPSEYESIEQQAISVVTHPYAGQYLIGGKREVTIIFDEPNTGIRIKTRLDNMNPVKFPGVIVDLKTCQKGKAHPEEFKWHVKRYRYDIQAAMYLDAANSVEPGKYTAFVFCVVESEPPYLANVFKVLDETVKAARERYIKELEWFKYYQERKNSDRPIWNGYPLEINEV